NKDNAVKIASQLVNKMRDTYEKNGKKVEISVSLGVAMSPSNGKRFIELYEKADLAMYEAKKSGRNGYHIYSEK
ncbi:diguanylate cyclase domain-containing protein, partial [Fusobacterium varium]